MSRERILKTFLQFEIWIEYSRRKIIQLNGMLLIFQNIHFISIIFKTNTHTLIKRERRILSVFKK